MRHPPRLDSASGKTLMPFPCFDLCPMAWREFEIVFHGTVVGAAILDFFATSVFLDDLEVDAFLFGIVTIIALTDFDLPGWNTGRRLDLRCVAARLELAARVGAGCALLVACGMFSALRALVGSHCIEGACVAGGTDCTARTGCWICTQRNPARLLLIVWLRLLLRGLCCAHGCC